MAPPQPHQFSPYRPMAPAKARGCFTCSGFQGVDYAERLLCQRDGGRQVIEPAMPACPYCEHEVEPEVA